MNTDFKPMLASVVDLSQLKYPVLCTPKLDGIRCVIVNGEPFTRALKAIPNNHINKLLSSLQCDNLDGELMVDGDFNNVQSAVMKSEGTPKFTYYVFDKINTFNSYEQRIRNLSYKDFPDYVKVLSPCSISNEEELLEYLESCLQDGYEGVMIRSPDSPYKYGRSTVKEGYLLKLKRFFDDEAELVEVTEKMHNANELEHDNLGYAQRSLKKEHMIPAGTAGSCTLKWKGKVFKVGFGKGFTDELKQYVWDNRDELVGQTVKFSYQELSKDGIPRFGKLLGFRHELDMSEDT